MPQLFSIILKTGKVVEAAEQTSTMACHHCGEPCTDEEIRIADHHFCCEGCKMVYEILQTNGLSQYYRIENRPGLSLKGRRKETYAWLDEEEVAEKLIDFQNDTIAKITFQLPQIHCASCVWLLENLHKLNPDIRQSKVNFLKREAYLTFEHRQLSLRQLAELLALIGYAPALNLGSLEEKEKARPVDRTFQYQLGVAGFAFGNIMLLSFPEYLGLTDHEFSRWFGYLNILLSLPIVFFSGKNYLQAAWYGLKQAHPNIDMPISLGILTLFGRSVFEIVTHTGAGYLDSMAGLVFFLLIGRWFQQRTYHRLSFERDYKSYFPVAANLQREGQEMAVSLDKLVTGDTIIVRNQELIPADGVLLDGRADIDYSFVSGESAPVPVQPGEKIFAGGRQTGEAISLRLTRNVSQSYLTQLWNDAAFSEGSGGQAGRLSDRVGKYFTLAILTVGFITLFYWLPKDVGLAINAFTAVLIIACPCAIALSIPFTLGNAIRLFARQGFYLKNTQVIENLANIDTVIFDKTGTITDHTRAGIQYDGESLTVAEKRAVRALAHQSNHPVSREIEKSVQSSKLLGVSGFAEVIGQGILGAVDGLEVEFRRHPAGTALLIDNQEKGIFSQTNQYRHGLSELIGDWKNHYQLYLLSGDNDGEKSNLEQLFPADKLYFHQRPEEKMAFIRNLQKAGRKVMMLGDGLNDAGGLQQSDVGIVITENTNNFTPASDAILDARSFHKLPLLIRFARRSIHLVFAAYGLALIYNVIGLSFAVQGLLSPVIAAILMPLSSVTIIAFGVLGTGGSYRIMLGNKEPI